MDLQTQTRYINPYYVDSDNIDDVRMKHFYDARVYNGEAGWRVPREKARKEYKIWLNAVRKIPGWENFRRVLYPVKEIYIDHNDNVLNIIRRWVSFKEYTDSEIYIQVEPETPVVVKRNNTNNHNANTRLAAQSRVKGAKIDDDEYRSRMFTKTMAQTISQLRNKLGLTQAQLANRINVEANMIRDIELGDKITFNSSDPMIKALARELGLTSIKYQE